MFRAKVSNLIKSHCKILYESRATYIRGYWPEPITQHTLGKFLKDINYFDEPKELVNIGLEKKKPYKHKSISVSAFADDEDKQDIDSNPEKIDEIFDLLSDEATVPPFNIDDANLNNDQLTNCAITDGIYRDLFGKYVPNRDFIKFTPDQAERLDKLVPNYWITDQPFARVQRKPTEQAPLHYFEPLLRISAKFIHDIEDADPDLGDQVYAHTSYHGNFIPACEACSPPAITLDGRLLQNESDGDVMKGSESENWSPGQVGCINFDPKIDKYYSLALVNLDFLHENASNLHWMLANIKPSKSESVLKYDEICKYLPVHGINGLGYSRYVFLVFQHDSKLDADSSRIQGYSAETRKFDANSFLKKHADINIKPIGLSWFQTSWDPSSNKVFHDYLEMRAPTYEHVQEKLLNKDLDIYPGKTAFNVFLDHVRSKKSINEQVLLERMKIIDPFDYKDQYVTPKVPPTAFDNPDMPSWMNTVMFKKNNKIGYWRGLRPASATLPLDNNADLDHPLRPIASTKKAPPGFPNRFQYLKIVKTHKEMPTSKPTNEFQSVFIQDDHEIHLEKAKKLVEESKKKEK